MSIGERRKNKDGLWYLYNCQLRVVLGTELALVHVQRLAAVDVETSAGLDVPTSNDLVPSAVVLRPDLEQLEV